MFDKSEGNPKLSLGLVTVSPVVNLVGGFKHFFPLYMG